MFAGDVDNDIQDPEASSDDEGSAFTTSDTDSSDAADFRIVKGATQRAWEGSPRQYHGGLFLGHKTLTESAQTGYELTLVRVGIGYTLTWVRVDLVRVGIGYELTGTRRI